MNKNIRGLAWIVLKWAGKVKPRVIILENVEEFQTWGPIRKGRPIKNRSGETFQKWKSQLEALGYKIEHRELVAADYGAPTIRKRFFLIARCDGNPIVWPEPTHAPADSEDVRSGKKKPWRAAAEIIDWNLPCPSIFDTSAEIKEKYGIRAVRPLAKNTEKRIARGLEKFVLQNKEPFIVPWTLPNTSNSVGDRVDKPIYTIRTGGGGGQLMMTPVMTAIGQTGFSDDRSYSAEEPIRTVVSKAEQCLLMPSLIQYHTEQSEKVRGQEIKEPIMTVDSSNRYGLTAAYLAEYFQNGRPLDVRKPMHTVTTKDRECVTETFLSKFYKTGIGQSPNDPIHMVTTSAGHFGVVTEKMEQPGEDLHHWPRVRELLNQHCDYDIAEDEIMLLSVEGTWYYISDIGLRMLTPKELYQAMGFPADYIIDHDYTGKSYGKTKQVARCGNAVPPPFAEALVRANLPEMCCRKVETMEELREVMIG